MYGGYIGAIYRGYLGVIEGLYRGYTGVYRGFRGNGAENRNHCNGYAGRMEKTMETIIMVYIGILIGFRV